MTYIKLTAMSCRAHLANRLAVLGSLCALLLLGLVTMPAHAQEAGGEYDLAMRTLESRPSDIRVGQETFFNITYENRGSAAVPEDLEISVVLTVSAEETGERIAQCAEQVASAAGLAPNEIQTYAFQSCDVIFRAADAHMVRAAFVSAAQVDTAPQTGAYLPLPDDADATNNGTTISIDVGPFESALPDELGQLFAGLGMFFAVMAIVAVGTEVVVESIKGPLGMKSKVRAMDALDQMEKYLPGKLAALGVSSDSQARFRELTASMRRTVAPVSEIPVAIEKVKRGDLDAAVELLEEFGLERVTIQELLDEVNAVQDAALSSLNQWRRELDPLFETLEQGLEQLKSWPLLSDAQADFLLAVEERVRSSREKLASLELDIFPEDVDELDEVPANLQAAARDIRDLLSDWQILIALLTAEVQQWSAEATADWLYRKRDELVALGRQEALDEFDQVLVPQLNDLDDFLKLFGASSDVLIQEARRELEHTLDLLEREAVVATDAYLRSLKNLLEGVEERRNSMSSPVRRFWRRLRQSPNGLAWAALAIGAIVWLAESFVNLTIIGQALLSVYDLDRATIRVGGALIDGVLVAAVAALIMALAGWLGQAVYRRTHDGKLPAKSSGSVNTLDRIEILWNWLRGDTMEPDDFGSPERQKRKVREISLENVAQVIFERTDQQRDEESARLRWLRVISIVIGFLLAYLLQLDAAALLDAAVPGIETTINRVLFIGGDRLHAWHPWLSAERAITAGIILTGFAAAAGSTFWHDRLDQLQAAKRGAESAARTVRLLEEMKQELEQ